MNINFDTEDANCGTTVVKITVIQGMSVRWIGPYTLVAAVPAPIAGHLLHGVRSALAREAVTLFGAEDTFCWIPRRWETTRSEPKGAAPLWGMLLIVSHRSS